MSLTIHTRYVGNASIGSATVTLAIDGTDSTYPNKSVIAYSIALPTEFGGRVHAANDLSVLTRYSESDTLEDAYRSLCSFLSASAEAYRTEMFGGESENGSLFPEDVKGWAYNYEDEISIESMEDDDYNNE